MASTDTPTYEILALRYGIFDGRIAAQNYLMPDDHMAPDPLDFLVFAIRGPTGSVNPRTIVMDTGFNPVSAQTARPRNPLHAGRGAAQRRHRAPRTCATSS